VNKCNGNRDIPIRDFPITTGVWAIGTRAKDRWKIVVGKVEEDGSAHHRCRFPNRKPRYNGYYGHMDREA
jgi:hypothetical protein